MAARAKVDEDLPTGIAGLLGAAGHDALTVADQGMLGTPDPALWPVVQAEARMLITGDKGFADLRAYPPGTHEGVVLLRADEESREAYYELIRLLLATTPLENLRGTVTVVSSRGVRIRR